MSDVREPGHSSGWVAAPIWDTPVLPVQPGVTVDTARLRKLSCDHREAEAQMVCETCGHRWSFADRQVVTPETVRPRSVLSEVLEEDGTWISWEKSSEVVELLSDMRAVEGAAVRLRRHFLALRKEPS